MDLREQLQASLGSFYTLERELGGGGMSRVFVAEEQRLKRRVVVKVLSPDLAQGISAERFEREIQVAASLQQANIVPVLNAGETAGLPYYTMPFVEGESLRHRLRNSGALPIEEAVSILRDVARALAFAHERGIIHRDIKPDNVLLSGGAAVVTDFGIAKAISAARAQMAAPTLTQLGTAIGTPAYISPEQAAGDDVDHRADLYSFGCMAYELLAGQPPFVNRTPQRLMAAHMSEAPQPLHELRPGIPAGLATLVMRCLEKDAASRPQTASEVLAALSAATSSGSVYDAAPAILRGGPGMLRKALVLYAVAFVFVAIVARAAIVGIGLPDWVFPGALIVMALGLPVILFTAYTQYVTRLAIMTSPTFTPGGSAAPRTHGTMATMALRASPHLSWRRTALGGAYAVVAFVLLIGTFMLARGMGIGPVGSLIATGQMGRHERIIIADFRSPESDTTLGAAVTGALRTGLSQSRNLSIMEPTAVREVLRRMQRPSGTRVDFSLAREIATREGLKAFMDGEVLGIGGKYVISARLVSSHTGEPIASFRATASDLADIVPAVDRLTKSVRSKVGESLRSVQNTPLLEQVTTSSLDALKKFVQGSHAAEIDGDVPKAISLLEEAISLDTGFAMAYRKLGVLYSNMFEPAKAMPLIEKAYMHRDRLSDAERYLVTGFYYQRGPRQDRQKAIAAYEALLDLQPDNGARNNLGTLYWGAREFAKAESTYQLVVSTPNAPNVIFRNLASAQYSQGKRADVERTLAEYARRFPQDPGAPEYWSSYHQAEGRLDRALQIADSLLRARSSDLAVRSSNSFFAYEIASMRGRVAEARRRSRDAIEALRARGVPNVPLTAAMTEASLRLHVLDDTAGALRVLEDTVRQHPVTASLGRSVPYMRLASMYAALGRPDKVRGVAAVFDEVRSRTTAMNDDLVRRRMNALIAQSEGRHGDAISEFRNSDAGECTVCGLPQLAAAFEQAGQRDSAIATLTRFVETPYIFRSDWDANHLAATHKRLGELFEAKGDKERAARHYLKFVDLWKNADPELQPRVAEVRRRLSRLADAEAR